jgi:hypothetical protein
VLDTDAHLQHVVVGDQGSELRELPIAASR